MSSYGRVGSDPTYSPSIPMKNKTRSLSVSLGFTVGIFTVAVATLPAKEGQSQVKEISPITADEVRLADENEVLPLPGEVLGVLKTRKPADWDAAVKDAMALPPLPADAGMVAVAVRLGVRTADAFLAVEAENSALLEKAMGEMLVTAEKLGAGDAILAIGKEMKGKAAGGEWQEVLRLLDSAHTLAIEAVEKVGDDESVAVAAAAGWLRGAQIYASVLSGDYSEEASKALRQPNLVARLVGRLNALPKQGQENPAVASLRDNLESIQRAVDVPTKDSIPQDRVQVVLQSATKALAPN
jgi:hypothetical protein